MLKRMVSPLVLAMALAGGTAWAAADQDKPGAMPSDQQTAASPSGGVATSTPMSGHKVLTADDIIDMKVEGGNGEKVGEVKDLVVDQSGRISGVIISVGGFLGIGDKKVSLPWDQLHFSATDDKLTTSATKQQLEQAAAWQDPDQQTAASGTEKKSGTPKTGTTGTTSGSGATTTTPPASTTR